MSKIDEAYKFYKKHIHDKKKIELLQKHNLRTTGFVPAILWELFCSILTGKKGGGATGADLQGWEVKSSVLGNSFEYQYHLHGGREKLKKDCEVSHLFCSYAPSYEEVVVKVMTGSSLADRYFKKWLPLYEKNYDRTVPDGVRRQRFRKSVAYNCVKNDGKTILKIKDTELTYRNDNLLNEFLSI